MLHIPLTDGASWGAANAMSDTRGEIFVASSSLPGVPQMSHSIFAKLQSISQRVVLDPTHGERCIRMDTVLFLWHSPYLQSLGLHRVEAI